MLDATEKGDWWTCDLGYVEAEYFVFGDVTKDYVCGMCVLLNVGYSFMEDGEGSVRPSTSPESVSWENSYWC